MTQPIDRETVIALADLWDSQWPTYPRTPEGIGGMAAVKLCAKELREAVANSRKDAEPVAWADITRGHVWWGADFPSHMPRDSKLVMLFTHPPEADKLLQQALEAVLDEHLPGFTEDAPRQHDDVIYDKAIEDAADAIQQLIARTYLEGK